MKKTIIVDINKIHNKSFRVPKRQNMTIVLLAFSPKKDASVLVNLAGIGAHATILGIIVSKDTAFTLHTLQEHTAEGTTSSLLVKSVLSGSASFVYDGGIRVDRNAQKTDAYQRNENLILSGGAHAQSKPRLEILANDVRCTHGATIGPVSENQLWYLASRGIGRSLGTSLIAKGFLSSALFSISDTIVRKKLEGRIWRTLQKLHT